MPPDFAGGFAGTADGVIGIAAPAAVSLDQVIDQADDVVQESSAAVCGSSMAA